MNIDKVDPARFEEWEFDLIDDGGIEVAFQLKPEPVYFVMRHGRRKKCFSRDTAIRYMAFYMTDKVFKRAGILSRVGETYTTLEDGRIAHNRGEHTIDYIIAHSRCMRRIRRLLAKQREILKWQKKYEKWSNQHIELMKTKPY
ncbi:TPA: hypothetical protein ACHJX8_000470 [Yersinia enterocolitica]